MPNLPIKKYTKRSDLLDIIFGSSEKELYEWSQNTIPRRASVEAALIPPFIYLEDPPEDLSRKVQVPAITEKNLVAGKAYKEFSKWLVNKFPKQSGSFERGFPHLTVYPTAPLVDWLESEKIFKKVEKLGYKVPKKANQFIILAKKAIRDQKNLEENPHKEPRSTHLRHPPAVYAKFDKLEPEDMALLLNFKSQNEYELVLDNFTRSRHRLEELRGPKAFVAWAEEKGLSLKKEFSEAVKNAQQNAEAKPTAKPQEMEAEPTQTQNKAIKKRDDKFTRADPDGKIQDAIRKLKIKGVLQNAVPYRDEIYFATKGVKGFIDRKMDYEKQTGKKLSTIQRIARKIYQA